MQEKDIHRNDFHYTWSLSWLFLLTLYLKIIHQYQLWHCSLWQKQWFVSVVLWGTVSVCVWWKHACGGEGRGRAAAPAWRVWHVPLTAPRRLRVKVNNWARRFRPHPYSLSWGSFECPAPSRGHTHWQTASYLTSAAASAAPQLLKYSFTSRFWSWFGLNKW